MAEGNQPRSHRVPALIIGLSVALFGFVVAGVYLSERIWPHEVEVAAPSEGTTAPFHKVAIPGINRPPTVEAARSNLGPDELVIGVVVGGRARAYRLEALRDRTRHLVNDVLGDVPVSVSFCDLDNCVRAYAGEAGGGPLGVSIAGLFEAREMVLQVDGGFYLQRSGKAIGSTDNHATVPLERLEPTLTTWSSWKRDHPETDVFEGIRGESERTSPLTR